MRKFVLTLSAIILFIAFNACKKSSSGTSNARTVQNFSGSYNLTALTAVVAGVSFDVYDTLPPCEKDNIIQLEASGTANFVDANTKCVPPSDSTGVWSLSANTDTLYIAGSASFIKTWDGKTLILTNNESINGFPVVATTTLVKQ
jgi:type II secretory pathway component GspD/PulD (secretin)